MNNMINYLSIKKKYKKVNLGQTFCYAPSPTSYADHLL